MRPQIYLRSRLDDGVEANVTEAGNQRENTEGTKGGGFGGGSGVLKQRQRTLDQRGQYSTVRKVCQVDLSQGQPRKRKPVVPLLCALTLTEVLAHLRAFG
jgi:hypothetical protein